MAVASATECGLTIESENNACMIMVLMPSAATKAIIQKIILTNKGRDYSSSTSSSSVSSISSSFEDNSKVIASPDVLIPVSSIDLEVFCRFS